MRGGDGDPRPATLARVVGGGEEMVGGIGGKVLELVGAVKDVQMDGVVATVKGIV